MLSDAANLPGRRTQQWAKLTQKNVQASQCKTHLVSNFFLKHPKLVCRAESQKLRVKINSVCNQAVTEIKSAWTATNTVSINLEIGKV